MKGLFAFLKLKSFFFLWCLTKVPGWFLNENGPRKGRRRKKQKTKNKKQKTKNKMKQDEGESSLLFGEGGLTATTHFFQQQNFLAWSAVAELISSITTLPLTPSVPPSNVNNLLATKQSLFLFLHQNGLGCLAFGWAFGEGESSLPLLALLSTQTLPPLSSSHIF
jgi:hypothetical protein